MTPALTNNPLFRGITPEKLSTPDLIEKEKYWHDREMCATVS